MPRAIVNVVGFGVFGVVPPVRVLTNFDNAGSPPGIVGFNYDQGDPGGGGQSIVITGTGMLGVTSVTFGGTSATILGTTPTTVTVTLPAHAAGVVSVVATNTFGNSPPASFEYWSPAQLSLTLWIRANWPGASPWVGNASAGTSAGKNLTAGVDPTSGTPVGGFTPAHFDGISETLVTASGSVASYINNNALTAVCLFKAPAAAHTVGGFGSLSDKFILGDTSGGYFELSYTDLGVMFTNHTDLGYPDAGALGYINGPVAAATANTYGLAQATYDGTTMAIRNNGGAFSTFAHGNVIDSLAGNIEVSHNSVVGNYLQSDVLEVALSNTVILTSDLDKFRLYCNQRYGVSV